LINNKKIIGIVPARIGSKGLKFKNLKKLNSKPLIFWPIKTLKKSKYIDKIILNTDSKKIRDLGIKMGAEVPFLRPKYLASDKSKISDTIIHTIRYFEKKKIFYDYLLLLEPTSPLTTTEDIDNAIEVLEKSKKNADALVSIAENVTAHPKFCVKLDSNQMIKTYDTKFYNINRQELDKTYFYSGNFYLSKVNTFIKKKTFYHNKTKAIISSKVKSFEIDDKLDFFIVEKIMKHYNK
jgi:CMP-N,N'-diacetyllegionaminic acid synthase|tara:strand:+ start:122 stop:832 length:711 start_codon:yes stop_codon:yes gene_type:complete